MLSNKGLYKSMQYVQCMLVVAVNFNLFQILWGLLLKLPFFALLTELISCERSERNCNLMPQFIFSFHKRS